MRYITIYDVAVSTIESSPSKSTVILHIISLRCVQEVDERTGEFVKGWLHHTRLPICKSRLPCTHETMRIVGCLHVSCDSPACHSRWMVTAAACRSPTDVQTAAETTAARSMIFGSSKHRSVCSVPRGVTDQWRGTPRRSSLPQKGPETYHYRSIAVLACIPSRLVGVDDLIWPLLQRNVAKFSFRG